MEPYRFYGISVEPEDGIDLPELTLDVFFDDDPKGFFLVFLSLQMTAGYRAHEKGGQSQ
jgi:excinuclease UvrABC helicase subunit UvrB